MPRTKEINITFEDGCIESVENIPRGQTVITRDVDNGGEVQIYVRRWHFDGDSELLYEGPLEHEDWREMRGL